MTLPSLSSASSISGESRLSIAFPDDFDASSIRSGASGTRHIKPENGMPMDGLPMAAAGMAMPVRQGTSLTSSGMPVIEESKQSLDAEFDALAGDVKAIMGQVGRHMIDLSKAAAIVTQRIRQVISACSNYNVVALNISPITCPSLFTILKVVMHFADNLLLGLPYASSRSLLLRAMTELGTKLKLVKNESMGPVVPQPRNFPISQQYFKENSKSSEIIGHLDKLMEMLTKFSVSDQDGAFIAPIARGFSENFAVVSVLFGVPSPTPQHLESVAGLWDISDEIHFFCQKNRIATCAGSSSETRSTIIDTGSQTSKVSMGGFRAPYRTSAAEIPPISMSIAAEDAETLSGTLGGYVYPKVDPSDPSVAQYSQSAFAMTCAHVCLSESKARRPHVAIPSPVFINMYRDVLMREYSRYPTHSQERRAFKKAVIALDAEFPRENGRNMPPRFGEVLWGERTLCHGMISDVAIIRCRSGLKPIANHLGDDISFSEYDPSLMFSNLTVSRVVKRLTPGLDVFKYGSTSKYTSGRLNGPRLIYWADGALQSSEFVVASAPSGMFASGGDSGAWILRKDGVNGLGVVGMLHAYDGEHREFGLFTPMTRILERLREVTGIEWGVVGVKDDVQDEEEEIIGGSETSDSSPGHNASVVDSSSDDDLE
ncbi:peptidase S64 [Dipodascopsis uninucleata]